MFISLPYFVFLFIDRPIDGRTPLSLVVLDPVSSPAPGSCEQFSIPLLKLLFLEHNNTYFPLDFTLRFESSPLLGSVTVHSTELSRLPSVPFDARTLKVEIAKSREASSSPSPRSAGEDRLPLPFGFSPPGPRFPHPRLPNETDHYPTIPFPMTMTLPDFPRSGPLPFVRSPVS